MIGIGEININGIYIGETPISNVFIGETEIWDDGGIDYSLKYLTFKILTDGTLSWKTYQSYSKTIYYSINDGEWIAWTSSANGSTVDVHAGDKVRLKGTNQNYSTSKQKYNCFEGGTATFDIYGNIMSLIYGDDFIGNITLPSTFEFCSLFKYTNVISAEHLILPAKQLSNYCYRAMFSFATLQVPPALPATRLSQGCYWYMFEQCPITTAPDLLAAIVPAEAYGNMFNGCSSLNYIKCLATDISADSAVTNWTTGVSTNGTFVKEPGATWPKGTSGVPSKWTTEEFDYSTEYFHYNILTDNTEIIVDGETQETLRPFDIYYSTDKVVWNKIRVSAQDSFSIGTYNQGENVYIKSKNKQGYGNVMAQTRLQENGYCFYATNGANICGNILSLILGDDFIKQEEIYYDYYHVGVFAGLFSDGNIIDASKLFIPFVGDYAFLATFAANANLLYAPKEVYGESEGCYLRMFTDCQSLISAPSICCYYETRDYCYEEMFNGCSSLTNVDLDLTTNAADTIGESSFFGMFSGCTSLQYTHNFGNIKTVRPHGCAHMYEGCTSLTSATDLPATQLGMCCYESMFEGCTGLVYVMETLPAKGLANGCYKSMFKGCTNLTESPSLPARALVENCYKEMFNGCTSLEYIECYANSTGATNCTESWTNNVSSSGTFVKSTLMTSWTTGINGIPTNWTVEEVHDYEAEPLTFEILSDGVITWKSESSTNNKTIQYRKNNGSWISITSSTSGTNISVTTGDIVQFKGNNNQYGTGGTSSVTFDQSTCSFNVYGNIMSLIDSENFANVTTLSGSFNFNKFFVGRSVVNAENLVVPFTNATQNCMEGMFYGCTTLLTAPKKLAATSLSSECYKNMFWGCTSLTATPVLPAQWASRECYFQMFYNCRSLTTVTCLATGMGTNATSVWLYNVPANGTFYKTSGASWPYGESGIPNGWTVVDYNE